MHCFFPILYSALSTLLLQWNNLPKWLQSLPRFSHFHSPLTGNYLHPRFNEVSTLFTFNASPIFFAPSTPRLESVKAYFSLSDTTPLLLLLLLLLLLFVTSKIQLCQFTLFSFQHFRNCCNTSQSNFVICIWYLSAFSCLNQFFGFASQHMSSAVNVLLFFNPSQIIMAPSSLSLLPDHTTLFYFPLPSLTPYYLSLSKSSDFNELLFFSSSQIVLAPSVSKLLTVQEATNKSVPKCLDFSITCQTQRSQ